MSTLLDLKNKITADIKRSDKSTQIADAITAAVRHYEREGWWFQEGQATVTTTASTTWYSVPTDFKGVDDAQITISGSKQPLTRVHYSEINETDTGVQTGQPAQWTYYQDQLRFYPIPNGQYNVTLSYRKQLAEMSDASSVAWTNAAFDLIRFRAEWDVYNHDLRNKPLADITKSDELEAYFSLMKEHRSRVSAGKLKRSGF